MGHSVTIISCTLADFPALAGAIDFHRGGAPRGPGLPPVGYSESNGQALIWIDRIANESQETPDLAELSRVVPLWVLAVVESEAYSILERYEAGEVVCALWSPPGNFGRLKTYGDCPFDVDELERLNVDYTRESQSSLGIEQDPAPFTIPILAFRELTGVDYDGDGRQAVEPAEATFPVEA